MFLQSLHPKITPNLHQVHYEFFTNLGLCQGNMSYLVKRQGTTYYWARELFVKMGLPEMDGVDDIVKRKNGEWLKYRRRKNRKTSKERGLASNRSVNRSKKRGK